MNLGAFHPAYFTWPEVILRLGGALILYLPWGLSASSAGSRSISVPLSLSVVMNHRIALLPESREEPDQEPGGFSGDMQMPVRNSENEAPILALTKDGAKRAGWLGNSPQEARHVF